MDSSFLEVLSHHNRSTPLLYSSFSGYFNVENRSFPHGSDMCAVSHTNSTSDEDHEIIQIRKRRRMLSNRESARRSRLRKQQHLDELQAHVAQLRAQNSQILTSFSVTSKKFAQLTEENRNLHTEALNLRNQLQGLHSTVIAVSANESRYTCDPAQVAPISQISHVSSYAEAGDLLWDRP